MKRLDTLIESIDELVKMGGGRKLIVVGEGNLIQLRREILKRDLNNWVNVVGFVQNPESYFE